MARRRPAWLPWIAAIVAVTLFSGLGVWQLQRAAEKEALVAALDRGARAEPVAFADVADRPAAHAFDRVRARGRFLADRQFLLDNRTYRGQAGFDVLVPLLLADGRTVLVDRGWVLAGPDRRPAEPVELEAKGPVKVVGRLWLPEEAVALGPAVTPGQAGWPRLTTRVEYEALTESLGRPLIPAVIRADAEAPWLLQPRPLRPAFGPTRHYGYAVQWFALAITVVVVAALLVVRRKRSHAG
jgi:surfeit locus 1 family protein